MLDTPPLRKRRGPRLVKGRWAGKIFLFPPFRPKTKPFSHCQKGTEGRDETYLYRDIGLYICIYIHGKRSRRIFLTRFVRNPSPVFRVLVSGRIFASAKY